MQRLRIFLLIWLPVCLLLSFGVESCKKESPIEPSPSGPDTTSHNFTWQVDTIGIPGSTVYDVWGSSPSDVYAVGIVYWTSYHTPTNIVHWDGERWDTISYAQGELHAVTGFSAKDIWAAGYYQIGTNVYSLIAHWDGSSWTTWKDDRYSSLRCIWGTSSSNLYAAGGKGVILHYDGQSWTQESTPTQLMLRGLWGNASGEVYAIGGLFDTGIGVMLKREGGVWQKVYERGYSLDSLSGVQAGLWGASAQKIYAGTYVGYEGHWVPSSIPNDNVYIEQIKGQKASNIFAVGSFGLLIHYNGMSWHRYEEFYRKPGGSLLYGSWMTDKSVFVAGLSPEGRAFILRGAQ